MKHRDFPETITIIKHAIMEQSDRSGSVEGSLSSSSRRPQDFHYDIKFTPQPETRRIPSAQNKAVRNRLRAFEIASRALRDASSCVEDEDFGSLLADSPSQKTPDKAASDHYRAKRYESLDFGNNSDSLVVLQIRKENLRRKPVVDCGPAREWGDLTYHNSSADFTAAPSSPPRYRPSVKN
jgi:hypothetical protein